MKRSILMFETSVSLSYLTRGSKRYLVNALKPLHSMEKTRSQGYKYLTRLIVMEAESFVSVLLIRDGFLSTRYKVYPSPFSGVT